MENKEYLFNATYNLKGTAPWTFSEPAKELVQLVGKQVIFPCRTLEVGCGEGVNSVYLAKKGFKISAFDFSRKAIDFAKINGEEADVSCDFFQMDYRQLSNITVSFDFVFDWRFLHEITDELERATYAKNIARLLNKNGKYLSVAFSGNEQYWGTGKIRRTPIGAKVYFATLDDTKELFTPYLRILEKKLIKVPQKPDLEITANYLLMEKDKN